jgi:hypothetical protein
MSAEGSIRIEDRVLRQDLDAFDRRYARESADPATSAYDRSVTLDGWRRPALQRSVAASDVDPAVWATGATRSVTGLGRSRTTPRSPRDGEPCLVDLDWRATITWWGYAR